MTETVSPGLAGWLVIIASGLIATAAALHALLHKRDPAAAFGWVAVCLLFPLAGPVLYFLFGVNRIRTRARVLRAEQLPPASGVPADEHLAVHPEFTQQARISGAVTGVPLTAGNAVTVLHDGEEAYPAMLEAIEQARDRIYLATYIFESNRTGIRFVRALARAVERGVDVRVLLDGAGEWYSWPRIRHRLRREGVPVARFLPPGLLPPRPFVNLRNHRKILVVDGVTAFVGGMNIGDRHLARSRGGTRDAHFRLRGAVVEQIETVFLDDWQFTTGDRRRPPPRPAAEEGEAMCRTLIDGPNEDLDRLSMVLVGAIAAARQRVLIMTPYFLPPRELTAALQAAAIRGVHVDIVLPGHNNLPFMHWATRNVLWELVKWGVHVHYQRGPFAHTKLLVVDDHYAQIGSANLDPRSLRLNFELVVEVFDAAFARRIAAHIRHAVEHGHNITLTELSGRPFLARVRDAFFWLFTPYL
ncbi:Major cardiolipin synthase ClsA [wastewater metagenome]|uniref:Major cardiolipin synthase ClsA n=2 Tax=unclassified sequences TaxID=12908 RepID=A0A5B8R837_9ZZZZ|nr:MULTISPECIES: phospholipase D-like domain-containing protein [Arhodomonas]MCS4502615.1 phospholipase D-like domain-containing protein [Arhodomonas aquaeolei]QEA05289.1 major cardiolipin synthase ClsA [uncultured organism]